jgi:hypothetical protein
VVSKRRGGSVVRGKGNRGRGGEAMIGRRFGKQKWRKSDLASRHSGGWLAVASSGSGLSLYRYKELHTKHKETLKAAWKASQK